MSLGWAKGKSRKALESILDQMVVEQAGLPALSLKERDALLSFHLAISESKPWANVVEVKSGAIVVETTKDTRLSAAVGGKKVIPKVVPPAKGGTSSQLVRWQITFAPGSEMSRLHLTVAKGVGASKKVVSWKASERPFSQVLP